MTYRVHNSVTPQCAVRSASPDHTYSFCVQPVFPINSDESKPTQRELYWMLWEISSSQGIEIFKRLWSSSPKERSLTIPVADRNLLQVLQPEVGISSSGSDLLSSLLFWALVVVNFLLLIVSRGCEGSVV